MTKQELLENAKSLSKQDRIDLAMDLWDLVDGEKLEVELSEEQKAELDRRLAAHDADPQPDEDLDTIREKLLRGEI